MNITGYDFFVHIPFVLLRVYLGVELLGHRYMFSFSKYMYCHTVSTVVVPLYNFSCSAVGCSLFSSILGIFLPFYFSHSGGCVVVLHYSDLHFSG